MLDSSWILFWITPYHPRKKHSSIDFNSVFQISWRGSCWPPTTITFRNARRNVENVRLLRFWENDGSKLIEVNCTPWKFNRKPENGCHFHRNHQISASILDTLPETNSTSPLKTSGKPSISRCELAVSFRECNNLTILPGRCKLLLC